MLSSVYIITLNIFFIDFRFAYIYAEYVCNCNVSEHLCRGNLTEVPANRNIYCMIHSSIDQVDMFHCTVSGCYSVPPITGVVTLMLLSVPPITGVVTLMLLSVRPITGVVTLMLLSVPSITGVVTLMLLSVPPITGVVTLMLLSVPPITGVVTLMLLSVPSITGVVTLMLLSVPPITGVVTLMLMSVPPITVVVTLMLLSFRNTCTSRVTVTPARELGLTAGSSRPDARITRKRTTTAMQRIH